MTGYLGKLNNLQKRIVKEEISHQLLTDESIPDWYATIIPLSDLLNYLQGEGLSEPADEIKKRTKEIADEYDLNFIGADMVRQLYDSVNFYQGVMRNPMAMETKFKLFIKRQDEKLTPIQRKILDSFCNFYPLCALTQKIAVLSS